MQEVEKPGAGAGADAVLRRTPIRSRRKSLGASKGKSSKR